MTARVILLTGPSGSGKTSLLRRVGAQRLNLDSFYRDGNEAGMPLLDGSLSGEQGVGQAQAMSQIDWDHPLAWDSDRAMEAILCLCRTGRTQVPVYSIPDNATTDHTTLDIKDAPVFVAEGIFAAELIERCRQAGVLAEALVLKRPRLRSWWFRLRRDLAERRKPLHVLLTRGLRLTRTEPAAVARWVSQGCTPVSRSRCEALITELSAPRSPRPVQTVSKPEQPR